MIKIPISTIKAIEADFTSMIPFNYDASQVTWSASGAVTPGLTSFGGQVNIASSSVGTTDLTVSYAGAAILTQTVEFYDPSSTTTSSIKVVVEDGSELVGDLYVPQSSLPSASRSLLVYVADVGGNPVQATTAFAVSGNVSGSSFTLYQGGGGFSSVASGIGLSTTSSTALGTLTLTGSGLTRNINLIAYNPAVAVPNLGASFKLL